MMSIPSGIAQVIWAAGNLPHAWRFSKALMEPERVQLDWLMSQLSKNVSSKFGREHDFASIRSYHEFARKVPLRDWDDFSPWIQRIRKGEKNVLGIEEVTHLAPTSGSTGARKLIPFNSSLHQSFAVAVGTWMSDLVRLEPQILGGPAYWSISPLTDESPGLSDEVPVGFADDAEYLGGWRVRLVRLLMAVSSDIRHERDVAAFWMRTASNLLARRDLRLISVWHPSFLGLILDGAASHWSRILDTLKTDRSAELRKVGPENPAAWWPALRVISCWGDQAAEPGMRDIARRFPHCRIQAKGLLATEAVITIPWKGCFPLAVQSHFFEFLSDDGDVFPAHELEPGKTYEIVVTNGGGLWRYRLGDRVECDGFCGKTPTLRFLGRIGNVSDLRGEKLSESFVADCLASAWPAGLERPALAFLRPCQFPSGKSGYLLVVDREVNETCIEGLEHLLCRNPHYELARRLGQLECLTLHVDPHAGCLETVTQAIRIGDIKPKVLDKTIMSLEE